MPIHHEKCQRHAAGYVEATESRQLHSLHLRECERAHGELQR
jgi:hypothetical protein